MTQAQRVAAFGEENGLFPRGGTVLCAVSGGADSVCMLRILLSVGKEKGFSVAAAHYDHRLRGAESQGDADFVRALCADWGVPCLVGAGDVAAEAERRGTGLEETAREMRYAFLREAAGTLGAHAIATAHTADDNAETILMDLGRGAGLGGLCGIPVRRGEIIRPMLCLTRADVLAYLAENGIAHREDSTNADDDCLRNRIRHHVMPELRELFPDFGEKCARTSALLREDEAYLTAAAAAYVRDGTASASALAAAPYPLASRAVRQLMGGGEETHVRAVLRLCRSGDPSGSVSVPGLTVRREYDVLTAEPLPPQTFAPVTLSGGAGEVTLPECGTVLRWRMEKGEIHKSFTTFSFALSAVCGKISVRPRTEGDRLVPLGRGVEKTVKKLMQEHRIPACRRGLVPVVCDEAGVLAVYGLCQAERTRYQPGEACVTVEFFERERKQ